MNNDLGDYAAGIQTLLFFAGETGYGRIQCTGIRLPPGTPPACDIKCEDALALAHRFAADIGQQLVKDDEGWWQLRDLQTPATNLREAVHHKILDVVFHALDAGEVVDWHQVITALAEERR